jgi:hypothetical protein
MVNPKNALWSYGTLPALGAAALTFLVGFLVLMAVRSATGWPSEATLDWVVLILVVASLTPVALRVLDFLAENRAVLGSKWFNLDLSRVDLAAGASREMEFLPANLGLTGPVISDTSPMSIVDALQSATRQPFAVVDIGDGDAWWVTRLIAFSAGAIRRGAPEAIVFVGRRENRPDQFLGWAPPGAVLEAILRDKDIYRERYEKAAAIARQLALFFGGAMVPPGTNLHPDVQRYTFPHEYSKLGEAALEQIVMDQLANQLEPGGSLEDQPDKLTLARLNSLFGTVLVTKGIDVAWPAARQIETVLGSDWPFDALVRSGTFVAMLRRTDAERSLLSQLMAQERDQSAAIG